MADIIQQKLLLAFGERLRQLRKSASLSQEALADIAGLDRTYVSSCERGLRNVTLETINKLANALGVAPEALVKRNASEENGST